MIRKKYAALMTLLAASTGLLNAQEVIDWSPGMSGYEMSSDCCDVQRSCCERSHGRFFVGADLLYWRPYISGLELDFGTTSLVEATVGGIDVITVNEVDRDPHFNWDCGYRISAGYQFACSKWEIDANWTHFHGKGSNTSDVGDFGTCKVNFDQVDLVLAYNACKHTCVTFKPFLGLRGANIRESVNANLVTDITLATGAALTETRVFNDNQNFHGLGPLFGLNGDMDLGCGFGIYGSAAASVLFGNYKVNFNDTDTFGAPFSRETISTDVRHLQAFDCNIDLSLGLRWETMICNCYELSFKLGVEHHQYFNQSHLGANRGDLSLDGGIFSIGLSL